MTNVFGGTGGALLLALVLTAGLIAAAPTINNPSVQEAKTNSKLTFTDCNRSRSLSDLQRSSGAKRC